MKRLSFYLFCTCALHLTVKAHVLDQYLQVAQIALAPDGSRIELRLVPGVQVAERIFTLMDADRDGQLSATEEQAYLESVLKDLTLEVNGQRQPLKLLSADFPARHEINEGVGAIRLTLTAETALGTGNHQLFFHNNHLPELSAYLINAIVPSARQIQITGQQRDALQHGLRLDYRVTPPTAPSATRWLGLLALCLCFALLVFYWKFTSRAVLDNQTMKAVTANLRQQSND